MIKKYEEAPALSAVAEFHETFNLPILSSPAIPEKDRCRLRINLLKEELEELEEALDDKDLTEVLDALCDLQYVLSGAILEFGCGQVFRDAFNEVQRSNMSKICHSEEEARKTVKHYAEKDGTESHIVKKGDIYLVYRNEDSKVLKSVNYSPANIRQFVKADN